MNNYYTAAVNTLKGLGYTYIDGDASWCEPVKLIDGGAYQLDYNNGYQEAYDAVMRYREKGDYFHSTCVRWSRELRWSREYCTNIQLLEVKSNG